MRPCSDFRFETEQKCHPALPPIVHGLPGRVVADRPENGQST